MMAIFELKKLRQINFAFERKLAEEPHPRPAENLKHRRDIRMPTAGRRARGLLARAAIGRRRATTRRAAGSNMRRTIQRALAASRCATRPA